MGEFGKIYVYLCFVVPCLLVSRQFLPKYSEQDMASLEFNLQNCFNMIRYNISNEYNTSILPVVERLSEELKGKYIQKVYLTNILRCVDAMNSTEFHEIYQRRNNNQLVQFLSKSINLKLKANASLDMTPNESLISAMLAKIMYSNSTRMPTAVSEMEKLRLGLVGIYLNITKSYKNIMITVVLGILFAYYLYKTYGRKKVVKKIESEESDDQ